MQVTGFCISIHRSSHPHFIRNPRVAPSTYPTVRAQFTLQSHAYIAALADVDAFAPPVTRSHKYNDRDHKGLAEGTAATSEHLPRFFAKTGHLDVDPKKIKKDGGGKGNWGGVGDEVMDENFRFTNARRRSNSSSFSHHISDFKTKFEVNEPEPVFEEAIHGPLDEDNGDTLSKTDSSESSSHSI